ncbi:hypothetical protein SI65_07526 [Aspergillus cristatus]|uniref:AP-3 complex subunit delta n=1 Tax=Aspergillus cristatus TaxID=573508 RepID=A0A1E3B856_ASPCR|nr:hypothetical protein SI65_07526 [Aspergillus cristatus]
MDRKATALLKIIYLEMFGYDMSWASFHVLEVMSSTKYLQKRVGYLGAMQSFRSDTEVLMLATNLLKKDIGSSNIPNMSLPMVTLPHVITPSLSMSLLPDILSRLSHSHVMIRKKAVVCLYRLALVYPEALKLAWPKIKERLMDDQEDGSVTTAVINVVCELGWRRPHDFLPLAPRLFDLLVEGGNNWMAIKIIKLFATLTPLEPRLVRKLLRPLTNLIQTTTAMSLLYECINGVIQGVKYVALLAFNRIVTTHPVLVSMQQDVILECLEDADVSIRLQALELATGMVSSETLQPIVSRLVKQLNDAFVPLSEQSPGEGQLTMRDKNGISEQSAGSYSHCLPPEYKIEVLHRIVDICSYNNYSGLPDFEWYIDILVQLVKHVPPEDIGGYYRYTTNPVSEIACRLGSEIRNIAVRVRNVRMEATRAAESLVLIHNDKSASLRRTTASDSIMSSLAWVVGEYAEHLLYPGQTLQSLIDTTNALLPARTLSVYLQAIPKLLVHLTSNGNSWDDSQKSETSLLLARIIDFLEALASHPDLDVQERAIEFLEILRLAAEAVNSEVHPSHEPPYILSAVIPSLFSGLELNPVAVGAQKKVPLPEKLVLDQPFNERLLSLLDDTSDVSLGLEAQDLSRDFYYTIDTSTLSRRFTALAHSDMLSNTSLSKVTGKSMDAAGKPKRRSERRDRNRDDPFYIDTEENSSGTSTPFHRVFNASNGDGMDVDSIPIIDLKINNEAIHGLVLSRDYEKQKRTNPHPKKYDVIADENFGHDESMGIQNSDEPGKVERSLLQVDTSGLGHFSLEEHTPAPNFTQRRTQQDEDEVEMAKAMQKVEKVRLEMQRASERIHPKDVPAEGTLVKKKKKKTDRKTRHDSHRTGPSVRKKKKQTGDNGLALDDQ